MNKWKYPYSIGHIVKHFGLPVNVIHFNAKGEEKIFNVLCESTTHEEWHGTQDGKKVTFYGGHAIWYVVQAPESGESALLAQVAKQARDEVQEEKFRELVEIEKLRIKTHRPWWKVLFPWVITIRRA